MSAVGIREDVDRRIQEIWLYCRPPVGGFMPKVWGGDGLPPADGKTGDIWVDFLTGHVYMCTRDEWSFVGSGEEVIGEAEEAWLKRGVSVEHISRVKLLLED